MPLQSKAAGLAHARFAAWRGLSEEDTAAEVAHDHACGGLRCRTLKSARLYKYKKELSKKGKLENSAIKTG